jgi:cytoskeletal protein CcmA (bactofilin family)
VVKKDTNRASSRRRNRSTDTTLGPAARLVGDLHCDGAVVCAAHIEGNLSSTSDLLVTPTAVVKGDVHGLDVTVAGRIEGNVTAEGLLVVQSTGIITGRISMARLVVDEGAYLRGDCVMEPARTET